ncbi:MAG: COG3014 family protein [Bacteroidota bacterium]
MKSFKRNSIFYCLLAPAFIIVSCATYYQKNEALMQAVYRGDLESAEKLLDDNSIQKKKDILLYYFNRGTVLWMNNKPEESNKYFRLADYYIEDYQKSIAAKAVSFITNPKVEPYPGEFFEQILLHYYTAVNYAQMGNLDEALVEAKRMLIKMQKITDYTKGKNKYKRDAFAHNLLGIIYDAQRDYNNAFIAYRNAYEIYKDDYQLQLATPVPLQLKKDLIRTAHLSGFYDDQGKYEADFKLNYIPEDPTSGNLIFFWNNGFGPIKDEASINFSISPAGGGWVNFINHDLGLNFPYYVGDSEQSNSLSRLKIIRVAFPRYISRQPYYNKAILLNDSLHISAPLEMAENVDAIAYKSLEDRMVKELSEALIRLALKQAAEEMVRKENQRLGAALSIVNAVTEQADTRNWQLLPYSINYTRVTMPQGKHLLTLKTTGAANESDQTIFTFSIGSRQTTFGVFHSIQFKGYQVY